MRQWVEEKHGEEDTYSELVWEPQGQMKSSSDKQWKLLEPTNCNFLHIKIADEL